MRLGIVLFIISIGISIVLLNPHVKKQTMSWLLSTDKTVLSQLEINRAGKVYKIIKVQNIKGIAVELYKVESGELMFLDAQQLSDKKDAFYKFGKERHNLFLKDINADGIEEIILPSLDKNMKARLNVYSFDEINETLRKETKH